MLPIRIAPSILSADFGHLADEIAAIGTADYVHVDVMDGHFVPNLTIGPVVIEAVKRATKLPLDVHLMIEDAERWVGAYAKAGADIIGVHAEACPHLHRTIGQIRDAGARVKQIGDGDVAAGIQAALPDSGVDVLMGIGGSPEGVITAAAIRPPPSSLASAPRKIIGSA